ncbi:MAG: hypothetical protein QNK37_22235 [Acidobacteriota bacterium]|nr:hypothetical protein [Acidobacteriota bacterium]
METEPTLSDAQEKFLKRQLRNKQRYLWFAWIGVIAGFGYLALTLFLGEMDGKTFVLVTLILLQARANLKQHKDATLLEVLIANTKTPDAD